MDWYYTEFFTYNFFTLYNMIGSIKSKKKREFIFYYFERFLCFYFVNFKLNKFWKRILTCFLNYINSI